jgi:hypothetical protein
MRFSWIMALMMAFFMTSSYADTLYQAQVGGYSADAAVAASGGYAGVGVGVGLGVGTGLPYTAYPGTVGSGYYSGVALPYEGANYPYGQQCCSSCATCDECSSCH